MKTSLSTYLNTSKMQTRNLSQPNIKRYRGQRPRKRVPENMNYYDHNILGLGNRLPLKQENSLTLFKSIDAVIRNRTNSQNTVSTLVIIQTTRTTKLNMMHYGCTGNPFVENKKILNAHRHSEINLKHFQDENYKKNISPFDYNRTLKTESKMKTVMEGTNLCADLKENNNILTTRTRNTLQTTRTAFNPADKPLIKMQKEIHSVKCQLDTLLKKQKEITELISKGANKKRYERLMKNQANIEKERRELVKEYKKLLNVELKVPEPTLEQRANKKRLTKSKNLKDDIKSNERKLEQVLNQRKVIIIITKQENARKLAQALELDFTQ